MSETSRRRRWLGRTLVGAGALALPLTASISYAAAQDAPAPPSAPVAAIDPDAPEAPEAPEAEERREVRTFVVRRDGPDGEPVVQHFTFRHPPGAPGAPQPPQFNRQGGEWNSEEFQREMEEFQREMETFRAEWAEQHGEDWARMAEEHRTQALALAEQARRNAPEVIVNCDGDGAPARAARTEDGRQQIVICDKRINRFARSSLRQARESIARNREISDEVRREVLEELDQEIERIEREED